MEASDIQTFTNELKQKVIYENMPETVSFCTRQCVQKYDSMYLSGKEELCIKNCIIRNYEFNGLLNQEMIYMARNI